MTTIPTGRFVWFEYVTKDVKKAQGFFGELFNWSTQDVPMPQGSYQMISNAGQTIGGYMVTPEGAPPHAHWLSHLQVVDAAATARQIKSQGGKIRKDAFKVAEMGTMAIVADPFDGTFALWQPTKPEGMGDYRETLGSFCWNELSTEQPEKSLEFYKKVGGFDVESMDMPGMGKYHQLKSDGKPRAGVMKSSMPGVPQMWTPYVHVANADQSHDKAKKLGSKIHVPPTDIPNVGRFSIFSDPLGGTLGILQPSR